MLSLCLIIVAACNHFENPEPALPPTPAVITPINVELDPGSLSGRIPFSSLPLHWPVVKIAFGTPRYGTLERDLVDSSYRYQAGPQFLALDTIPYTVDYAREVVQGHAQGHGRIIVKLPGHVCLPRPADDDILIPQAGDNLITPILYKANDDTCVGTRYVFPSRMPLGFYWHNGGLYYRHFPRSLPRVDTISYRLCSSDGQFCRTATIRVRVPATDCGYYLLARPDTLRLRQRETYFTFLQVLANDRACTNDLSTRSFAIVGSTQYLNVSVDHNMLTFRVQIPSFLDSLIGPTGPHLWLEYEIRSESTQGRSRTRVILLPP